MGRSFHGALPRAPADGVPGSVQAVPPFQHPSAAAAMDNVTKDALRRLIAAELRELLRK